MNRNQRRLAKKQGRSQKEGPRQAVQVMFGDALRHHGAGRLAEAERLYRQVLAADGRHSDSLHLLGLIAYQVGRYESAVELIGQAIRLRDDVHFYYNNLGLALTAHGKLDEAVAHYERALALKPDYAEPHLNLGNALRDQGKPAEAVARYERALAIRPDYAEAHNNLGLALAAQGKLDEAVVRYEHALALKPDYAELHINLGNALRDQGKPDEAVAHYERALALKPDYAEAHNNLGLALKELARFEEALASYDRALAVRPDFAEALNNRGNTLNDQGKLAQAVASYRRALAIKSDYPAAHSNLLFALNYLDSISADAVFAEHVRFGRQLESLLSREVAAPFSRVNLRDARRRLRVGYVSPDFRRHSVSYFLEPILRSHDRKAFELFCYAEVAIPDDVTHRLRGLADHWLVTVGMSDNALAERIRTDRIDILVDLAGHTANNRLPVFARKPAPIQVTWLGYPNTTGLSSIDYRLVDAVTDPEDDPAAWTSETLVRLSNGFLCYGPPTAAPPPGPPPLLESGAVTFSSFNNPNKLSPSTLDTWATLLDRLPQSRLLLKGLPFADAATCALFHSRLAERGVAPDRLTLMGQTPDATAHLALYRRVDIALDPFPYNGTTTTCEALWMGVPVVTLRGDRHSGRVGASLLGRLGLDDLIARDAVEYIEIVTALCADRARLAELRTTLRARMARSALCNAQAFAHELETAYRTMWRAC
jgi:protein O-GlcNAc transferase